MNPLLYVSCFTVRPSVRLFVRVFRKLKNLRGFIMGKKLTTGLTAIAASMLLAPAANAADSITDAFKEGKAGISFRLRYEDVDQGDIDKSADALTLKTRLNFKTADYHGIGSFIEFDNVNALDYSSYNSGTNNLGPVDAAETSVIKDPEYTQINQAYFSYTNWDTTAKWGKQRILLDNQRFVGGVGWRQNEQTYDAFSVTNKSVEDLTIFAARVYNVNGITDDSDDNGQANQKSDTILLNVNYAGFKPVQPTFYVYNIENIAGGDTANTRDTMGLRVKGAFGDDVKFGYTVELATQEFTDETTASGDNDYEADYNLLEGFVTFSGVTIKLGNELQGADETDANNGTFNSFKTPLGTNHAHNGWADQFLSTPAIGLNDTYLSVSGKVPGGVKLVGVFHTYTSDEEGVDVDGNDADDLGSEIDLVVAKKFGKNYGLAFKYAAYSEGDEGLSNVDATKFWLTATAKF